MSALDKNLREQIKDAALDDHGPAIIEALAEAYKQESQRQMNVWMHSEECKADDVLEDSNKKTPRWLFWSSMGYDLEYVVRNMLTRIEQRDWTNGQIRARERKAEIERKREELARLEKSKP